MARRRNRAPALRLGSYDFHPAMIVTVVAVRMVQVTFHQVIDMASMRYGLVATIGPMPM